MVLGRCSLAGVSNSVVSQANHLVNVVTLLSVLARPNTLLLRVLVRPVCLQGASSARSHTLQLGPVLPFVLSTRRLYS